jgi:hypothetical protein
MASEVIRIELRFNYRDKTLLGIVHEAAKRGARELLTAAALISDGNQAPQCVVTTEGSFQPITTMDINEFPGEAPQ